MKKILSILLVLVICLGLLTGVVLLITSSTEEPLKEVEYKFTNVTDFTYIKANTSSTDIIVKKGINNDIVVKTVENNNNQYEVSYSNGRLIISEEFRLFNFSFTDKKMYITVPEKTIDVELESSSGDIEISDTMTFDTLNINTSSGDTILENITIEDESYFVSSSGKFNFKNIKTNSKIEFDTSSSDVVIDDSILTGVLESYSSSGKFKITDSELYDVELETSSGDIDITPSNTNIHLIKVDTSSGKTTISLKNTISGYQVTFDSSSGDFYSNFSSNNPNYFGDGSIMIDVESSSGDLKIFKK